MVERDYFVCYNSKICMQYCLLYSTTVQYCLNDNTSYPLMTIYPALLYTTILCRISAQDCLYYVLTLLLYATIFRTVQ